MLRYLSGTKNLALRYYKCGGVLTGYSDSDWAGDYDDRHSTSGNLFMFGGAAICWSSRKQPVVALSTAESEYIALSAATQEAAWLQKLLTDLRMPSRPIVLMENNQGAIALTQNPVAHSKNKHIDIRFHFIREAPEKGMIQIKYSPSEDMLADLLTKPLPKITFTKLHQLFGLKELM